MSVLLVVTLLVTGLVVLALVIFLVLRALRASQMTTAPYQAAVVGPAYRSIPASVEYYRDQPHAKSALGNPAPSPTRRDPRNTPLARCPECGAAIAFNDDHCAKCRAAFPR